MTTVAEGIAAAVLAQVYNDITNIVLRIMHMASTSWEKHAALTSLNEYVAVDVRPIGVRIRVAAMTIPNHDAPPIVVVGHGTSQTVPPRMPIVAVWQWQLITADPSPRARVLSRRPDGQPPSALDNEGWTYGGSGTESLTRWLVEQVGTQEEDIAVKAKALLDALDEVDL